MVAAITTFLVYMASTLIVYPVLRFLYALIGHLVTELFTGSMIGMIAFFAGIKFIRYFISIVMTVLGYNTIYYLFIDKFVSQVYSLVIDKLLRFPPEFTKWLTYFGVFDGLRLLEAVFIWVIMFKVVMWALKPPSSLI